MGAELLVSKLALVQALLVSVMDEKLEGRHAPQGVSAPSSSRMVRSSCHGGFRKGFCCCLDLRRLFF